MELTPPTWPKFAWLDVAASADAAFWLTFGFSALVRIVDLPSFDHQRAWLVSRLRFSVLRLVRNKKAGEFENRSAPSQDDYVLAVTSAESHTIQSGPCRVSISYISYLLSYTISYSSSQGQQPLESI
jgi:hypothetical protein